MSMNNIKINSGCVTVVDDDAPEQECEFNVKLKGRGKLTLPALPDDSYSLEEKKTTATWIDGKPIYRKTILLTSDQLPENTTTGAIITKTISYENIGILGHDTVIEITGFLTSNEGVTGSKYIPFGATYPSRTNFEAGWGIGLYTVFN